MQSRYSIEKILDVLLPFAITLIVFAAVSLYGLDTHHDGTVLKPALDVWYGQTLYKDSFSQYGPLVSWIQSVGIRLLGPHLFAIRWTTVFFYGLISVLLMQIWRLFLDRRWSWVSFLVWLNLAPFFAPVTVFHAWSSVFALFFQLSATLSICFLFFSARRQWIWGFLAGVVTALAFWCRQPVGVLTIGAFIVVLFFYALSPVETKEKRYFSRFVPLLSFVFGLVIGLGIVALHLYSADSLSAWYRQNIQWPIWWAKSSGGNNLHGLIFTMIRRRNETIALALILLLARPVFSFIRLKNLNRLFYVLAVIFAAVLFFRFPKSLYQTGLFTLIPITAILIPLLTLLLNRGVSVAQLERPRNWSLFSVAAVILASWPQFYPVPDSRHLYWAIALGIGFFIFLLQHWLHDDRRLVKIFIFVWFVSIALTQWTDLYKKVSRQSHKLDHPLLEKILVEEEQAKMLNPLLKRVSFVQGQLQERPIIVEGPDSFYAALTLRLDNANWFHCVWKHSGLGGTQFTENGRSFIHKFKPLILSRRTDMRPEDFPKDLKERYIKDISVIDPFWRDELTLWVPRNDWQ